jgi:exopolyphosphatase/guanosine-5'-triphosphate,3'-diphosphate pyrophosphatase
MPGEILAAEDIQDPSLVAAVDLGSNSFHLLVGRVEQTPVGPQIFPIDSLKEPVRLASGLSSDKRLDAASQARALACLARFGERLRALHPDHVRAVATNTFRVAKNGPEFMQTCEAALGFPIEVIAGKEEARLIYNGVAHSLAADGSRRLVVDIGGGSTEFIIGTNYTPELLESVFVGCIRFTRDYFPGGDITRNGFKEATLEARREIQVISQAYRKLGWDQAVGSSGTAKAIAEMQLAMGEQHQGLTREGMEQIRAALIRERTLDPERFPGVKPERLQVLPGGLSIMIAIFEELGLEQMEYSEGALRLGVLYDVLGRGRKDDMRFYTVEQFMERYGVDAAQADRVSRMALSLWEAAAMGTQEERREMAMLIEWACQLLEVGHSISHNSYHKHSAYIVSNADMPGFSRRDQRIMATLVLGHVGKLAKVQAGLVSESARLALVCIRLAAIFHRNRAKSRLPKVSVSQRGRKLAVAIDADWLKRHPLTRHSLEQECSEWRKVGFELEIV